MFTAPYWCVCTTCPGRLNVGNDELDEMMKEASGPINFTIFLTMFGEKLKGSTIRLENILMGTKTSKQY